MSTLDLELNEKRFIDLLGKVIGHTEKLQNKPPKLVPQETLVGDDVLSVLDPYLEKNGGVIKVERIEYHKGRNNLIVTYPGTTDKTISFVGMHMDVVTATPSEWEVDPFKLKIDGDKLWGRGTTDCLGHVCLVTDLLATLAEKKIALKHSIIAVYIADEEHGEDPEIGIEHLAKDGHLKRCSKGPVFWMDSADKQPCVGTGAFVGWTLKADGYKGHSGVPQNTINPIILANQALAKILDRFHKEFPEHKLEKDYGFKNPSTMKPTQISCPPGSLNQIPSESTIRGDIRMTPFYDLDKVKSRVLEYVKDLNDNIEDIETGCSSFKNKLPNGEVGKITFTFDEEIKGVYCDKETVGFKALSQATEKVLGKCEPFAVTGSLPLIADLKNQGLDLQICGYGVMKVYHAVNEYCTLSGMKEGYDIIKRVIDYCEKQ